LRPFARDAVPGRGIALGSTISVITLVVLIPLATVVFALRGITPEQLAQALLTPRALAAFRLTVVASLAAACVDLAIGVYLAWVLVRFRFPGRRVLDALIDVPLAIPTAVTGITLATLYGANGWVGRVLEAHGIHVAYTPLGIGLALTFVGLPFVVRTVEPVLAELPRELDEAAAALGASRAQIARRVTLPLVFPAMLTGFALSLARALGEYGSVVFISGNMPGRTEIAPLAIVTHLEEYDYQGAAAIATVLLVVSFALLFGINGLQRRLSVAKAAV
jgi:sulfate transport system permease protein